MSRWLALLLAPTLAFSQVLRVEKSYMEREHGRLVPRNFCGNAVYLGNHTAITVGHVAEGGEMSGFRIRVNGAPATVVRKTHQLALLHIDPHIHTAVAKVALSAPRDSDWVTHVWWNHRLRSEEKQATHWTRHRYVAKAFIPGQSGSGVYNQAGELTGLAELTSGYAWDVADIRRFLNVP